MPMTEEEKSKCQKIIHGHAAAAAAGNLVPVPGVGLAADVVTMSTMAMALAAVFGGSITESVAKNMAINAIVATMKKQPIRVITKEVSKIVPVVGQLIGPAISVAMLEAAGWILADELIAERDKTKSLEEPVKGGHYFQYERDFEPHNSDVEIPATMSGGHNFRYEKKFKTHDPE